MTTFAKCRPLRRRLSIALPMFSLLLLLPVANRNALAQTSIGDAIAMVKKVAPKGVGQKEAVIGIKALNQASISDVPEILRGMNGASSLAVNWIRSSVVSIVDRGGELPVEEIKSYFANREGSHLGRLLAFDLISDADAAWGKQTIPTLLDDPSLPLRSKAVTHWIEKSESAGSVESLGMLTTALEKARDVTQIQDLAGRLAKRGIQIDLQKQLGFLNAWNLVGSFDNKDGKGFDVALGPESNVNQIDLTAAYEDQDGEQTKWSPTSTVDPLGVVDLNGTIGPVKGATVYAHTIFDSENECSAEIRIGTANAHKIWVNGKLVMSNEIYHNSNSVDKFVAPIELQEGKNVIMVKVCQNEQKEPWAQRWEFQIRICDSAGKPISTAAKRQTNN